MDMQQHQLMLEQRMHDNGITQWLRAQERREQEGNASQASWNRRLMQVLVQPLAEGIDIYLESLKGKRGMRSRGAYILPLLDTKVSAYIAIRSILDLSSSNMTDRDGKPFDLTVTYLCKVIGERIGDNIRFTKLSDAAPKYIESVYASMAKAFSHKYRHQKNALAAAERRLAEQARTGVTQYAIPVEEWQQWTDKECIDVGLLILDVAERVLFLEGSPLFYLVRQDDEGYTGSVTLHLSDAVQDWVSQYKEEISRMFPAFAPSVVPPRDWTGPFNGGYYSAPLSSRLSLVKSGSLKHRKTLTRKQMPTVYKAVNYLQRTAWQVNRELLDALDTVYDSRVVAKCMPDRRTMDERIAAGEVAECPVPEEYRHLKGDALVQKLTPVQADAFKVWKADMRDTRTGEKEDRGKLALINQRRQQAREYLAYPRIYFVWNLDDRSRVYCNSSRLSPQGDDLGKALIRLADGKPLGASGRKWLAVHGCGVYAERWPGFDAELDKLSPDERVRAIECMQESILDYALLPTVYRDWMQADKPWQFLAWCQEWARLIAWEQAGNKTEEFISHIPVALDGSCSGIQHYSAMLRDRNGGYFVNLCRTERQQDIYGEVARRVLARLSEVNLGKVQIESPSLAGADQKELAHLWTTSGLIDRGFCKSPVMTLPYGSTQITAREKCVQQLTDKIKAARDRSRRTGTPYILPVPFNLERSASEAEAIRAKQGVTLFTSIEWQEIGETVPAARSAMRFIKSIARAVAKENRPLRWTTPTGFVVEQAKYETDSIQIDTCLLGRIKLRMDTRSSLIDVQAMTSAAAPNFVHSLDASHLMFVCCAAQDAGIPGLACIHDSFGATAGDTERLAFILRDQFYKMYAGSNPLLSFWQDAEQSACASIEAELPSMGDLDLREIYDSLYCFT